MGRFPHGVGEMSRSDKRGRPALRARSPHEKKGRKAAPQEGEQTVKVNHPVDDSLERLCGRLSLHVKRATRRDPR